MNNSIISVDELGETKDFSLSVYGIYQDKEKVLFRKLGMIILGAGINSSANDMANWLKLWLNYGSFEGKRIISEDYIRNAINTKAIMMGLHQQRKISLTIYLVMAMVGIQIFSMVITEYIMEDLFPGFSSNVVLFPADGFGIVVLSNQHNTDLPYTVASMLALRMLSLDHNKTL